MKLESIQLGDMRVRVHPGADVFPLVEGEEFDALVQDIRDNGLQEPVILTGDKSTLVDGRNRARACAVLGIGPNYKTLPGSFREEDLLGYIVSANLRRRQLNPGQAAMAASDLEPLFAEVAKQRQRESGGARWKTGAEQGKAVPADLPEANRREREAREQAAKAVGAKGRTVSQAKAVKRDAPELADAVRSGKMSLDAADKKRKQMVANKPKPPKPPQPNATPLTLFTHKGEPVQYPKPKGRSTFNETPGDGISWAAWSWNPVTGCLHGCNYCYAREIATSKRYESAYPAGFTPLFHSERLEAPSNTSIPAKHADNPAYRRVFVCSMADLYGRWVPDEWISQVHAAMMKAPQWQYITLTKFPSRYVGLDIPDGAWVGASVDTQARVSRTEDAFAAMRELPAGRRDGGRLVKWLSIEPLLGPLEFADLSMFDWVVIGAQTRTVQPDGVVDAVAPQYDWFHSVYSQARAAGCRVHVKPNLLKSPGMVWPNEYPA